MTISSFFVCLIERLEMKTGNQQKLFTIAVVLPGGNTKLVNVKAATKEAAERRALKRNPAAIDIHRS